jgi:hypothetical protein
MPLLMAAVTAFLRLLYMVPHGCSSLADVEAAEYIIEKYSLKEVQHVPIICAIGW